MSAHSVFFRTNRDYRQYSQALRNLINANHDVQNFLQKYDRSIRLFPVVLDDELANLGSIDGRKQMMGFNYQKLAGLQHFVAYSLIYNVHTKFGLPHYYIDGYMCAWGIADYKNFVMVAKHKAQEGVGREAREYNDWLYRVTDSHIHELFR